MTAPSARPGPPYTQIVADIRARIESGELRPGDRVPSTREITRRWGVAMATATKALTSLRQENLIRALPGIGTVVQGSSAPPSTPARQSRSRRNAPAHGRAPDTALNHEMIVRTAIAIADAEGIPGLSMRRVATELGVSTMALYRHVPGKEELILLMADAVFTQHPLPEPSPGWREGLELAARRQWNMFREHPWVARILSVSRPLLTPGTMAHTEWMMRVLRRHGYPRDAVMHAIIALTTYTLGMACQLGADVDEENETGVSMKQWWDSRDSMLSKLEATGQFPHLFETPEPPDINAAFEFGLLRLLDGFALFFNSSPDSSRQEFNDSPRPEAGVKELD